MRTAVAVCLSLVIGVVVSGCVGATTREYSAVLVTGIGPGLYSASTGVSVSAAASNSETRLLHAAVVTTRRLGGSHFVITARKKMPAETTVERPGYFQMTYIHGQLIPISIPAATRTTNGLEAVTFRVLKLGNGAPIPPGAVSALAQSPSRPY